MWLDDKSGKLLTVQIGEELTGIKPETKREDWRDRALNCCQECSDSASRAGERLSPNT